MPRANQTKSGYQNCVGGGGGGGGGGKEEEDVKEPREEEEEEEEEAGRFNVGVYEGGGDSTSVECLFISTPLPVMWASCTNRMYSEAPMVLAPESCR